MSKTEAEPLSEKGFPVHFVVFNTETDFPNTEAAVTNSVAQEIENNPTAPWYIVKSAAGH